MKPARRTIITGASSGIGEGLAREFARRGDAVALLARRADLLESIASELKQRGANVVAISCDVSDSAAVHAAVRRAAGELGGPFDLAIANAGVSIPMRGANFKLEDAERVIRVNVLGMMYLFDAVIPSMVERRSGHFVGVASVAGLRGLPTAAPYSASKAAMQTFLESVRVELAEHGVAVTTVNPGFVATPMTEKNRFRMPFLMDVSEAVPIIADGLYRRARVIEFPLPMSLAMRLVRLLPDAIYDRITAPYSRRNIDPARVKR
jgi:short-subunit dehydrogenase